MEVGDRLALGRLVKAYAHHVDRREPDAVAALFCDDGVLAIYEGDPDVVSPDRVRTGREEIAAALAGMTKYEVTTHFLGQQMVRCRWRHRHRRDLLHGSPHLNGRRPPPRQGDVDPLPRSLPPSRRRLAHRGTAARDRLDRRPRAAASRRESRFEQLALARLGGLLRGAFFAGAFEAGDLPKPESHEPDIFSGSVTFSPAITCHTSAPMIPPMTGNTMNTHSCSNAQPSAKIAVARLRAGFTDVLSIGMLIRCTSASMKPIGIAAKPAGIDDRVAPITTSTRIAVKSTSAMITAPSSYPVGECEP